MAYTVCHWVWCSDFFCIETIPKSTLTLTQILAKCSHISFIACTVDKPLWQKTFEAWKMVCLRTCQAIFGHHLQVSAMIYTEEWSVCFCRGCVHRAHYFSGNAQLKRDGRQYNSILEDKGGGKEERGKCKKERRRKKRRVLEWAGSSWFLFQIAVRNIQLQQH